MPYLIEVLGQPNWQVIKPLLRACPQPKLVLPLLVKDLANLQRFILVLEVLREVFDYPTVLPWLISGLANASTRQHTRRLIEKMARTYDGDLVPDIVHLFNPAIAQPEPLSGPLPEVQRTLQELLTTELAQDSLPALVVGLAEPPLREGCANSLVTLAHVQQRQKPVLQAVIGSKPALILLDEILGYVDRANTMTVGGTTYGPSLAATATASCVVPRVQCTL